MGSGVPRDTRAHMRRPSLTSVPGFTVGQWTHPLGTTGVSLIRPLGPCRGGVARAGYAIGSRQMDALDPAHVSGNIDGVCFVGGSAFGLAAADGVLAALAERGVGFKAGPAVVPIVPTAVIFDLAAGAVRPDAAGGRAAVEAASDAPVEEGAVGAGAGAAVAKWTGERTGAGVGSWSLTAGPWTVGALAVVNALGSIRDPDTGAWLAGSDPLAEPPAIVRDGWKGEGNTTLVAVATDAPLDRVQCGIVAQMATAGMARAIVPVFTPADGDVAFCLSSGDGPRLDLARVGWLGALAAQVVARAVTRAVPGGRA